ncbi:MAG: COG1470 family protein [Planctomycetota bacterium]
MNLWEPQGTIKKYQKMYPNILILSDPGTVWNTYKLGGYIPLNYVIGHDFSQTVDYCQEGFDEPVIMDHITNLLSPVSVQITSGSPTYPPGTPLDISIVFTNHETSSETFYALVDVALPGSSVYYPLAPLLPFTLVGSEIKTIPIDTVIPATVPLGTYNLRVHIGKGGLWFKEDLDFDIDT